MFPSASEICYADGKMGSASEICYADGKMGKFNESIVYSAFVFLRTDGKRANFSKQLEIASLYLA